MLIPNSGKDLDTNSLHQRSSKTCQTGSCDVDLPHGPLDLPVNICELSINCKLYDGTYLPVSVIYLPFLKTYEFKFRTG
jgi:hypothetical protein